MVFTIEVVGRSNAVAFLDNDVLAVAADGPDIQIYSIGGKAKLTSFPAHDRRVRCLKVVQSEEVSGKEFALVTASNDGWIKVGDF